MAAESVIRMSVASTASSLCNFHGSRTPVCISNSAGSQHRRRRCSSRVQSLTSASLSEFFGSFQLRCALASKTSPLYQKRSQKSSFSVFAMAAADGMSAVIVSFYICYRVCLFRACNWERLSLYIWFALCRV